MPSEYALELIGISKAFPGVVALNDVTLRAKPGEVLALVGANGAGKSTILKIMFGAYASDAGSVTLNGNVIQPRSPHHAQQLGISMVHQELQLIPELNATQNMFLGREHSLPGWLLVNSTRCNAEADALLQQLGIDLDVRLPVKLLSVAQRQMIEIAKALLVKASVIALDEPTSSLTPVEVARLFEVIRGLKARSVAVIYVSHRLEELPQIADHITVLRDGKVVGDARMSDMPQAEIVRLMTGHEQASEEVDRVARAARLEQLRTAPEALRVTNLQRGDKVRGVSFALRKGEILGVTGLIGAGRTETMRALFGADAAHDDVQIEGKTVSIRSPRDAIRHGVAFLPEDRKAQGLLMKMSVALNVALTSLKQVSPAGLVTSKLLQSASQGFVQRLKVQPPQPERVVSTLSGGNQQKVILARWLCAQSTILIFDEPTRGIDIGAKEEIYHLMEELVSQGKSIIMVSSELPEVMRMSDRILVMRAGRIVHEMSRLEATQTAIMNYATGGN